MEKEGVETRRKGGEGGGDEDKGRDKRINKERKVRAMDGGKAIQNERERRRKERRQER